MTVDGVVSFARRRSALALLSILALWGVYFNHNAQELIRNDFHLDRIVIGADHLAFYTGARLTRFGPQDKVYDNPFVSKYQRALFFRDPDEPKNDTWQWLEAFRNPPFYAMLYWPLCGVKFYWSSIAWLGVSLLLTWIGITLTTESRRGRTLLWVLSFLPTYMAFDYGQNTPISFAVFAATYALMKKNRPFAAGLVAGLLLFKPQLLLGLAIWGLLDFRRKWPCALGVIVTAGLLFGVTYPIIPDAWQAFFATFNANREFDSFHMFKMHNPLAFIRLLLPADEIATHWFPNANADATIKAIQTGHNVFALLCGLAAAGLFVKLWRHRRDDLNVMFGGVIFLTLWANPHALIYEWMLLALTGILWVREWGDRPNTWFVLYAVTWGVLYFSTDLSNMILDANLSTKLLHGVNAVIHLSVPVTAGVGFYAVRLLTKPVVSPAVP